jgi:hypothetical protein
MTIEAVKTAVKNMGLEHSYDCSHTSPVLSTCRKGGISGFEPSGMALNKSEPRTNSLRTARVFPRGPVFTNADSKVLYVGDPMTVGGGSEYQ